MSVIEAVDRSTVAEVRSMLFGLAGHHAHLALKIGTRDKEGIVVDSMMGQKFIRHVLIAGEYCRIANALEALLHDNT